MPPPLGLRYVQKSRIRRSVTHVSMLIDSFEDGPHQLPAAVSEGGRSNQEPTTILPNLRVESEPRVADG